MLRVPRCLLPRHIVCVCGCACMCQQQGIRLAWHPNPRCLLLETFLSLSLPPPPHTHHYTKLSRTWGGEIASMCVCAVAKRLCVLLCGLAGGCLRRRSQAPCRSRSVTWRTGSFPCECAAYAAVSICVRQCACVCVCVCVCFWGGGVSSSRRRAATAYSCPSAMA